MLDKEGKRGKKKKKWETAEGTLRSEEEEEEEEKGVHSCFYFLSSFSCPTEGERDVSGWAGAFQTSFSCAPVYSCFYLCAGVVSLGAEMCHLVQLAPTLQKNQQAFCWISLCMWEGRKQFSDWLQVEATIERSHTLPFPPDYLLSFFWINI